MNTDDSQRTPPADTPRSDSWLRGKLMNERERDLAQHIERDLAQHIERDLARTFQRASQTQPKPKKGEQHV